MAGEYLVNLQSIRYFLAVAENLNFTRASEKLFVSQPAISRQIKMLEQELRVTLLERDHHAVSLTEAGRACIEPMKKLLAAQETLVNVAALHSRDVCGTIRIAYPNISVLPLLSDGIKRVTESYPQIKIEMLATPALEIVAALQEHRAELGVLLRPFLEGVKNFSCSTLKPSRIVAILPKDHPLAEKKSVSYCDVKPYPLITHELSDAQLDRSGMAADFRAHGLDWDRVIHERKTEDIFYRIALGQGVGIMPDGFLYINLATLVAIPICDSRENSDIVLAWHNKQRSAVIDLLLPSALNE